MGIKANDISPGVVIVTKFCTSDDRVFDEYVEYMDRDEAVRTEGNSKFNLFGEFMDYMDDPERSSGLFTSGKDSLIEEEKAQLKAAFKLAQNNESLMWQTVISFDNAFLEENGLYDRENQILDEKKLKEITRGCMRKILKEEGLQESSIWSASFHYNTDNIHIHIATVEPFPQREMIKEGKYAGQRKGTWKMGSINAGRSYVVNNILDSQLENQKINSIIRENIIESKKRHPLHKDKDLAKKFMEIHSKMPSDKRKWNYAMNAMKEIRPELDELTTMFIEKYCADDFEELNKLLEEQEDRYTRAYGAGEQNHMAENKIKDLYVRMGNTILKEMKEYDNEVKKVAYEEAKTRKRAQDYRNKQAVNDKVNQDQTNSAGPAGEKKQEEQPLNEDDVRPYTKSSYASEGNLKNGSNNSNIKRRDVRFKDFKNCFTMSKAIGDLKKSMKEEYQHARNQMEYDAMKRVAERELEQSAGPVPKQQEETPNSESYM